MATFYTDTFNEGSDTALESHTSDSGSSYNKLGATGATVVGATDKVVGDSSGSSGSYTINTAPGAADYYIELTGSQDATADFGVGIYLRYLDTNNFLRAFWDGAQWSMTKTVTGSTTGLGSSGTNPLQSATRLIRFDCAGSNLTLTVAGTAVISVSDGALTLAGKGGFHLRSYNTIDGATGVDTTAGAGGQPTMRRFGMTEIGRRGGSFRPTDIGRDGGAMMRDRRSGLWLPARRAA